MIKHVYQCDICDREVDPAKARGVCFTFTDLRPEQRERFKLVPLPAKETANGKVLCEACMRQIVQQFHSTGAS